MTEALNKKDFPGALKYSEAVLESNYVNIDAHYMDFMANREMGAMTRRSSTERLSGLINSIRNSGDGKSPETAWVVINVHEGYVLLRVLGLRPSGRV